MHNTALLVTDDRVVSVQADIRRPEDIFGHPDVARLIDLGEPISTRLRLAGAVGRKP